MLQLLEGCPGALRLVAARQRWPKCQDGRHLWVFLKLFGNCPTTGLQFNVIIAKYFNVPCTKQFTCWRIFCSHPFLFPIPFWNATSASIFPWFPGFAAIPLTILLHPFIWLLPFHTLIAVMYPAVLEAHFIAVHHSHVPTEIPCGWCRLGVFASGASCKAVVLDFQILKYLVMLCLQSTVYVYSSI